MHSRVGGVVIELPQRPVDDETAHRPDIEDGPFARFQHVPPKGAGAPEGAVQIDIEDIQPMLIRHRLRRCFAAGDTGIRAVFDLTESDRRSKSLFAAISWPSNDPIWLEIALAKDFGESLWKGSGQNSPLKSRHTVQRIASNHWTLNGDLHLTPRG